MIIVLIAVMVILYFVFKKTKQAGIDAGQEEGERLRENIQNDAALSAQSAGKKVEYSSKATVTEDMSAAQKLMAKAQAAKEEEEYQELLKLQTEYYNLTKRSAVGLTADQIKQNIQSYKDTQALLEVYIKESGDKNANIWNEEYDTYGEVMNKLIAYRNQAKKEYESAVSEYKSVTNSNPPSNLTTAAEVKAALDSWKAEKAVREEREAKRNAWNARKQVIINNIGRLEPALRQRGIVANKHIIEDCLNEANGYDARDFYYFFENAYARLQDKGRDLIAELNHVRDSVIFWQSLRVIAGTIMTRRSNGSYKYYQINEYGEITN